MFRNLVRPLRTHKCRVFWNKYQWSTHTPPNIFSSDKSICPRGSLDPYTPWSSLWTNLFTKMYCGFKNFRFTSLIFLVLIFERFFHSSVNIFSHSHTNTFSYIKYIHFCTYVYLFICEPIPMEQCYKLRQQADVHAKTKAKRKTELQKIGDM